MLIIQRKKLSYFKNALTIKKNTFIKADNFGQ